MEPVDWMFARWTVAIGAAFSVGYWLALWANGCS